MEKIRVEIKNIDSLYTIGVVSVYIILMIWLAILIHAFSVAAFLLFVLAVAAFIMFVVKYECTPTVITVSEETLEYKHLFGKKSIPLSSVTGLLCEPYEAHGRYTSSQRIRLVISVKDDGEYEFNDAVNTNDMLTDKLDNKQTELALIQLYDVLKEMTGVGN